MSHVIKHIYKKCDENISTHTQKKIEKKRKFKKSFKRKEFNEIVLGKGFFVCLTKGHSVNLEGQVEIRTTSSEVIFDTIDSN